MNTQVESKIENRSVARSRLVPRCDIHESASEVKLYADVPGASESDVAVTLEDAVLTVSAPIAKREVDGWRTLGGALSSGEWRRSFHLSREADPDGITASAKDGVLTITVKKRAPARASIKVASG